ncbi:S1C family serine protease [Bacteroidetes bacterium endosymbiont of Geopemphigus sp.]|uniref:S1C family serine protease n=1 Tax=Bacteroidetes bacterium endosymbiont of Geopemphigus sp. TaxID=2047937 RepID=UPI000CD0CBF0|nr:trypsin-like peptidase domain-containing protein [Bacteroidetes bacterium endosymbiont of Geopemphigus sp.]
MKKLLFTGLAIGLASSGLSLMAYKRYIEQQQPIVNTSNSATAQLISNPAFAVGSAGRPDFTGIAAKAVNAVVNVKNYSNRMDTQEYVDPFEFFFDFPQRPRQRAQTKNDQNTPSGHGSGVIISPSGYIATNNHVIDEADRIEITLNNQKSYKAKVVGKDPNSDVALLKIKGENLPYLNFADSEKVQVGEWVLAIGNPFSLNSTVTAGIVSAKGRSLDILRSKSRSPIESFIQTDAAINPGNSGGALVNTNGDLIGINTAIASKSGSYVGYGFAVPSNLVRKVIEDIKKFGVVQRAYIGINALDLSNEEQLILYNQGNKTKIKSQQGVMASEVMANSGAAEAGIKKGDIIKRIDGSPIRNYADLAAIIGSKRPGDKIKVNALRDGRDINFIVTLKDQQGSTKVRTREEIESSELLGAKFVPLENAVKPKLGISYGVPVSELSSYKSDSV